MNSSPKISTNFATMLMRFGVKSIQTYFLTSMDALVREEMSKIDEALRIKEDS